MPFSRSWSTERLTRLIGTAKPTPSLPPEVVLICWSMPITLPSAPISGPPELPGLIEVSVWIAPSILNWVSESIERSVAETIPTESDCSWPNGLPIAATGAPTWIESESPSAIGFRSSPSGSTLIRATSAFRSVPMISAGTWLRSPNST